MMSQSAWARGGVPGLGSGIWCYRDGRKQMGTGMDLQQCYLEEDSIVAVLDSCSFRPGAKPGSPPSHLITNGLEINSHEILPSFYVELYSLQ